MRPISDLFRSLRGSWWKRASWQLQQLTKSQLGDTFSSIAAKLGLTVAAYEAAIRVVNPITFRLDK